MKEREEKKNKKAGLELVFIGWTKENSGDDDVIASAIGLCA